MDFSEFFKKYEKIREGVDKVFAQVCSTHPEQVRCGLGCSDCCNALFDLSLVEALYLNARFNQAFTGATRSRILDRADQAEREGEKIKRMAHRALQEGRPPSEILAEIAKARLRCPLLDEKDLCELYEHRPLTCRLYGIPTNIGGEAHTCGRSGFTPGVAYPTVNLEKLQDALLALSRELVASLRTRHTKMADVLAPVSMTLMNAYDADYLGIIQEKGQGQPRARKPAAARPKSAAATSRPAKTAPAGAPVDCASCNTEQGSDQCSSCSTMNWDLGAKPKAAKPKAPKGKP